MATPTRPASLFPSEANGGSAGGKQPLVQFRAGRMNREANWVKPDERKGLVVLDLQEDGLLHFLWKDRSNNNAIVEDLIVFPQDADFKHVPQCTTGRVYVLHFTSSQRKLFFWLQEPKTDKDEENCTKINSYINNPHLAQQQQQTGGGAAGGAAAANPFAQFMRNATRGQAMRRPEPAISAAAPGPAVPSSASSGGPPMTPAGTSLPPVTPGAPAPNRHDQANMNNFLQNILSTIQVPPAGAQQQPLQDADLSRILTPESVAPLLQDPAVQQRLFPFLPEKAEHSKQELEDIIRSPQFRQAVGSLNHSLQSGQQGPLIAQLGLDPAVGGPLGGVEAFLAAIRQQAGRKKAQQQQASGGSSEGPSSASGGDDPDRMDTN